MKQLSSPGQMPSKARDKRKLFTVLCAALGALAAVFFVIGLTNLFGIRKVEGFTVAVLCVMTALPMLTLLLSGYADGHARRGVGSTLLHIVLFGELAIACLALGVTGNTMLKNRVDGQSTVIRAETFKSTGLDNGIESCLNPIFSEGRDQKGQNNVKNKVFSNKRKTASALIDERIAAGISEHDLLNEAIDIYLSRAREVFPDDAQALTEKTDAARQEIIGSLISKADSAVAAITVSSVKDDMNPKETPYYALMYFSTALIAAGIVCAALCVMLIILWCTRDEAGRARVGEKLEPLDYLLPFLVGVGVFTLYPMVRVFVMSFQERYRTTSNGAGTFDQWGIGNYAFVLGGSNSEQFMRGLRNTATYVLFTVPITAAIAIVIAWLLNQKSKLNALFQTAYFLPMVTTATAVGMVWKWMFNGDHGLINMLISAFTQFFGNPEKIQWLMTGGTNHTVPMAVLIIYGIWNSLPFTIILLLSGLQNIDENLYTVARVDGSSGARIFFKITVPLLSPTIGLVLIINSISAFKIYTEVFVLWSGKPENYQMETVTWYIYNNIIMPTDGTHSLGYAAAAAMILFAIIFVFTMIQKFIQRKWVYQ